MDMVGVGEKRLRPSYQQRRAAPLGIIAGMSSLRNIRMLTRYSAWANEKLFESLSQAPAEEIARPGPGAGSVLKTLNHLYVVDRIWQANLEERAHGYTARNTEVLPAWDQLRRDQLEIDAWYVGYAAELTLERHDEVVAFTFVDGSAGSMSRGDMLLHVVNHRTYHRGYVAEMLYRNGRKPPTMDLPVFLRDVPQPAA
jgi:uncharacterized damage-inducible protein DinB